MLAWFRLDGEWKRTFKCLACLSMLYVFPIIWADYYYLDDWKRSMAGFAGWEFDGRPLTTWLMKGLSLGSPLLDISPLPLVCGVLLLSYALVLFSKKYLRGNSPFITACTLFFFIANPFFLENLSFKYDVLSMCLSLTFIITIFALPESINLWKLFIISIIFILLSLNLYQPAICTFFCFCFIKFLLDIYCNIKIKKIVLSLCILLSSCFISLTIYHFTTVKYYLDFDIISDDIWERMIFGYSKMHSSLIQIKDIQLLYFNIQNFIHIIHDFIFDIPLILVDFSFIFLIILIILINKVFLKNNHSIKLYKKIIFFLAICISPFLIFINSFLFMTLLANPVFSYRVMVAFGCFLLCISISLFFITKLIKYSYYLFMPFMIFFVIFSYLYGNTIKNQKNYDISILQKLSYDLDKLDYLPVKNNKLLISFYGNPLLSKQLILMKKHFRSTKYLFTQYYPCTNYSFYFYALPHIMKFDYIKEAYKNYEDSYYMLTHNPDIINELYKIYIHNDKIMIVFDANNNHI